MLPAIFHRNPLRPHLAPRDWDPFAGMTRMLDLFDDNAACNCGFAVDVREDDERYRLTADLPGLERDDVEITVDDDVLNIEADSDTDEQRSGDGYHIRERRAGKATRSFRLPDDVDADKIEAAMKSGVLTVTLPKTETAKPKTIKVEVE